MDTVKTLSESFREEKITFQFVFLEITTFHFTATVHSNLYFINTSQMLVSMKAMAKLFPV